MFESLACAKIEVFLNLRFQFKEKNNGLVVFIKVEKLDNVVSYQMGNCRERTIVVKSYHLNKRGGQEVWGVYRYASYIMIYIHVGMGNAVNTPPNVDSTGYTPVFFFFFIQIKIPYYLN